MTTNDVRAELMARGMWRRLLVVPFEQEVPEDQMDEQLPNKLQAEADANTSTPH